MKPEWMHPGGQYDEYAAMRRSYLQGTAPRTKTPTPVVAPLPKLTTVWEWSGPGWYYPYTDQDVGVKTWRKDTGMGCDSMTISPTYFLFEPKKVSEDGNAGQ